jgi:hypothetical protein
VSSRAAELTAFGAAIGLWSAVLIATMEKRDRTVPIVPAPRQARQTATPTTPTAGVAGRVLDAAGHPVAGAIIFLRALATESPDGWLRAITDAAGNFRIAGLLPGFYALIAHDELHNTASERLPLLADATARIQLVLDEPITI